TSNRPTVSNTPRLFTTSSRTQLICTSWPLVHNVFSKSFPHHLSLTTSLRRSLLLLASLALKTCLNTSRNKQATLTTSSVPPSS
ncbi:hypothetical protein H0H87_002582, partial [Tephrocybe sp. NHM501043]